MFSRIFTGLVAVSLMSGACAQSHTAYVRASALPPPPEPVVRHSSPLWVELFPGVSPTECVTPKENRALCFADVDHALASALERGLWPSFPRVSSLGRHDEPAPGDYVLRVDLSFSAVPPGSAGPGWAALGKGHWQLFRDGKALASEALESRSRADFPYGHALGLGAGEVVDAIAFHVASTVGALAETRPDHPAPLPPVQTRPETPAPPLVTASK